MRSKDMKCGLKIRFEVMGIINNSHHESVKLPSAQELAERFGMSRRSVTMELKNLIDEGWLYGVRGSGTYTNPERAVLNEHLPSPNIIGVLTGDTRQYCYDYNHWAFLCSPGYAMMPNLGFPHPVRLSSLNPTAVFRELTALKLDGIIWSWPPDHLGNPLRKLMRSGVRIVTLMKSIPEIPSVRVDYKQCGRDIAALLLKEKRSNIMWCAFDSFAIERMTGAIQFLSRRGYDQNPEFVVNDMASFENRLIRLIDGNRLPDAIYLHGTALYALHDIFEKYGLNPYDESRIRLIAGWSVAKDIPGFRGIIRKYPYDDISKLAVEILQTRFHGDLTLQTRTVNMEVSYL